MTPEKKRQVKNALYEEFARIGKAASSPRRLELLDLLSQGEKSVETLAEQAALTVKNTSAQLKVRNVTTPILRPVNVTGPRPTQRHSKRSVPRS